MFFVVRFGRPPRFHHTPPPLPQPLDPLLDLVLAPFPIDVQYGVRRRLSELGRAVDNFLQSLGGGGPPRLTDGR